MEYEIEIKTQNLGISITLDSLAIFTAKLPSRHSGFFDLMCGIVNVPPIKFIAEVLVINS